VTTPTLDGMPRRLFVAFPTRLTTWQACRRRYRFSYLDLRPKAGPWAHFSLGSSVHEALRRWWDLPPGERGPEAVGALLDRHWINEGYRDGAQSAAMRATAHRWVTTYVAEHSPEREPIGVERSVATVTSVLSVRGRIDRIDERRHEDGTRELVVVDYKTSRTPCDEGEARTSLQLAMYSAAVERTLRAPCRTVELHHVPSGTIARWTYREGQRERHLARADELGAEAREAEAEWSAHGGDQMPPAEADALFPPSPEPMCGWCAFRSSCPEGEAASRPVEPWAAIADAPTGADVG
jgi:RecB family exonuclease